MQINFFKSTIFLLSMFMFSSTASANSCSYYLGYIKGEAERAYAIEKVYRYTPEMLEEILSLRDQGQELCMAGDDKAGMEVLLKSIKLISFTRLQ